MAILFGASRKIYSVLNVECSVQAVSGRAYRYILPRPKLAGQHIPEGVGKTQQTMQALQECIARTKTDFTLNAYSQLIAVVCLSHWQLTGLPLLQQTQCGELARPSYWELLPRYTQVLLRKVRYSSRGFRLRSADPDMTDVITITVHKTCSTMTFFPTYGWVTTNGSTSPFTFSPTNFGSSESPTVTISTTRSPTGASSNAITLVSSNTATNPSSRTSSSLQVLSQGSSRVPSSSVTSGLTSPIGYASGATTISPSSDTPPSTTTSSCVTATPSSFTCPQANGTLYIPAGGCIGSSDTFVVFCAVEFTSGGLIRLDDVASEELCIELCSQDVDCVAVAFDTRDRSCYEKSAVVMGNATANPDLIFAIRAAVYYPPNDSATWTTQSASTFSTSLSVSIPESATPIPTTSSATGQSSPSPVATLTFSSPLIPQSSSALPVSSSKYSSDAGALISSSQGVSTSTTSSFTLSFMLSVSTISSTSGFSTSLTFSQTATSSLRSSSSQSSASLQTTSSLQSSNADRTSEPTHRAHRAYLQTPVHLPLLPQM
jgi:hypothetical protein